MTELLDQIFEKIQTDRGDDLLHHSLERGELTVVVIRTQIVKFLTYLRDDASLQFKQLIDLCGVDYPGREERFEVVYHLLSLKYNHRIRVKVTTDENTPVPTVTNIYSVADWFEREAFDLFGITFDGHPDLRRLLTDYGFQGFPLRKDFPLTGFVEPRYDDELKRVVYHKVELPQEFRTFDFLSPWAGLTPEQAVLPGDEKASKEQDVGE
jgi:NADH-quinone oxidoreductase subunit C